MALLRRFAEGMPRGDGKTTTEPVLGEVMCPTVWGSNQQKRWCTDILCIYIYYIHVYIYTLIYMWTLYHHLLYVGVSCFDERCGITMAITRIFPLWTRNMLIIGHWILMDFRDTLFSNKRQTRAELVASPNKGAWKLWEHVVVLFAEFSYWWVHCCFGFMFCYPNSQTMSRLWSHPINSQSHIVVNDMGLIQKNIPFWPIKSQ
jgi:hypothetical protein